MGEIMTVQYTDGDKQVINVKDGYIIQDGEKFMPGTYDELVTAVRALDLDEDDLSTVQTIAYKMGRTVLTEHDLDMID